MCVHVHVHMFMSPSYLYLASTELSVMVLEKIEPDPWFLKLVLRRANWLAAWESTMFPETQLCNPLPGG